MAQVHHVPAHSLYPWSFLHGSFLPRALVTSLTDVSEHRRCSPGLPGPGLLRVLGLIQVWQRMRPQTLGGLYFIIFASCPEDSSLIILFPCYWPSSRQGMSSPPHLILGLRRGRRRGKSPVLPRQLCTVSISAAPSHPPPFGLGHRNLTSSYSDLFSHPFHHVPC